MGNRQSCIRGATDAWSIPTTTHHSLGYQKQDELTVAHWSSTSESSSASLIKNSPASVNNLHLGEKSRGLCERCSAIDLQQILSTPSHPNHPRSMEVWHLGEVDYNYDCALYLFFHRIRRRWSYFVTLVPSPKYSFHIRRYIVARQGSYSLKLFAIDEMKGASKLLSDEDDSTTSTKIDHL